jgi:hypothetical protein
MQDVHVPLTYPVEIIVLPEEKNKKKTMITQGDINGMAYRFVWRGREYGAQVRLTFVDREFMKAMEGAEEILRNEAQQVLSKLFFEEFSKPKPILFT